MALLNTLTVSTFYMIAQMVGAGALVKLLLGGYVTYNQAVTGVGILMIIYVVFGGMLATPRGRGCVSNRLTDRWT